MEQEWRVPPCVKQGKARESEGTIAVRQEKGKVPTSVKEEEGRCTVQYCTVPPTVTGEGGRDPSC